MMWETRRRWRRRETLNTGAVVVDVDAGVIVTAAGVSRRGKR